MQTIVFILGAILLVLILWIFPHLQLKYSKADIKGKDRIELKNKLRLTLAQILGGAFILGGLFFTWQSLNISKEGQITERFTRAIEQLGDDELQIRLGGIYALERIAKDSKRDHWPIMEILTTYIRIRAPWPAENREEKESLREKKTPPPDIQAILTVIGRRTHTSKEEKVLMLSNTDLRGAFLRDAFLYKANLSGANLHEAFIPGANLGIANLSRANLEGARLDSAFLYRAALYKAFLYEAKLGGANLYEASFYEANLSRANLSVTNLYKASFYEANLSEANLSEANLYKTDLRKTKNLTIEQLSKVKTLYKAKLDPDIKKQIEEKYPDLLKKPKPEKKEKEGKTEPTGIQRP
jgi:hypothetical protein